jgi:hypothetical protein
LNASVLHRAAGLIVAADRPLPGFLPQPAPSRCAEDLRIHLQTRPPWHALHAVPIRSADTIAGAGEPNVGVSRSADGFHFAYTDGTRAWIDASGTNVWCTWPASASLDDTCTYLYGPILGLVLRLRGSLAFHASAVQIDGGTIGFAGPHGAGKSTLAAALGAAGCAVVTDDVLHVRREGSAWLAEPFTSMLKLWPEGAQLALRGDARLPRIAAGWNKRALALGDRIPAADIALPLIALACLAEPASRFAIEPISPAAALLRLAANSSASHLLDRDMRATEFRALSALVRDVPCAIVTPSEDPLDYSRFVDRVLAWGHQHGRSAS